jgi:hypothetical protein
MESLSAPVGRPEAPSRRRAEDGEWAVGSKAAYVRGLEEGTVIVKHSVPPTNGSRKRKLWLLVVIPVIVMAGSTIQFSRWWFDREKMSFLWDWNWDSSRPTLENLADCFYCDWGYYFSITEHPDEKTGYVGITYQRWTVGPLTLQRVDYQRPGTSYD